MGWKTNCSFQGFDRKDACWGTLQDTSVRLQGVLPNEFPLIT